MLKGCHVIYKYLCVRQCFGLPVCVRARVCVCARLAYPRIDFKIKSTNFLGHFDEYFVISFDTMQISKFCMHARQLPENGKLFWLGNLIV